VSIIVTVIAQKQAISDFEIHPLSSRIANAFKSFAVYLQKIVWPADLMPFYPYQIRVNLFSFEYILSLLIFFAITICCIILWKKKNQNFWLASWIYYVITLLPVIGIVQIGRQEMADRYMYLPSIGPFIVLGMFASILYSIFIKRNAVMKMLTGLILLVIIALLSNKTIAYTGVWKNGISLWNHEIKLLQQEADRVFYRESLEVPFFNRGVAYEEMGSFEQAIQDYTTVLSINEESKKSLHRRGLTYSKMDMNEEAIEDYNTALQLVPDDAELYYLRGNSYVKLGHYQKALDDYSIAIRLSTEPHSKYYMMRGLVFKLMGKNPESRADFNRADFFEKNN
jgi:tetratricopeptide (TPR) repeat protein